MEKNKNVDIKKEIIKEINNFYRRKKMNKSYLDNKTTTYKDQCETGYKKEDILKSLASLKRRPYLLKWRENGTSESFIRGYQIAIEHICQELNISLKEIMQEIYIQEFEKWIRNFCY